MLEVVSVPVKTGRANIDCWMDIQRGVYPNVNIKFYTHNKSILKNIKQINFFKNLRM